MDIHDALMDILAEDALSRATPEEIEEAGRIGRKIVADAIKTANAINRIRTFTSVGRKLIS